MNREIDVSAPVPSRFLLIAVFLTAAVICITIESGFRINNRLITEVSAEISTVKTEVSGIYESPEIKKLCSLQIIIHYLSILCSAVVVFLIIILFFKQLKIKNMKSSDEIMRVMQAELEKEHLMISSVLHDYLLQDLATALLSLSEHENDQAIKKLLGVSEHLREYTYQIGPIHLKETGLKTAIETSAYRFCNFTSSTFKLSVNGNIEDNLADESRLIIYRIVQIILLNLWRKTEKPEIELKMVESHPFLIIKIKSTKCRFKNKGKKYYNLHRQPVFGTIKDLAAGIGASLDVRFSRSKENVVILKYKKG